ncbi:MAG: response regulator [Colwellia polaris]|jgi:two-component system OmpR family response regulator|tara:strand:- start:917 stop:1576 length:660 start_codon:yes stop_codon:yes gene_type:complete
MRLLLIEDDVHLANGLKKSLRNEGYSADGVLTGREGISAIRTGDFDLAILDLGLPDIDGLDVLKQVKDIKKTLPVLILTARDGIENKVKGLDLGADDYLAKPFSIEELLARLRVIERRLGTHSSSVIKHNQVELDTQGHTVFVNDIEKNFSRREYMIVKSLLENVGRIQSKEQLESRLYEWGEEVASNTIEVHISNIRKKLPEKFIKNVRGVGYVVSKT